jgi:PAS domain-containing protein
MDETHAPRAGGWPDLPGAHAPRVLEALSAALFDNNHDLVFAFAPDGRVERVNRRLRAVLGYEPGEIVGRTLAGSSSTTTCPCSRRRSRPRAPDSRGRTRAACPTATAAGWRCGRRSSRSPSAARCSGCTPGAAT